MFPELAEPVGGFDPLAAQNEGNSRAGAALLNLTADSTVNLPGNLLGFGAKVAGQVGRNIDPSIDPAAWRQKVTNATTFPRSQTGDTALGEALAPVGEAWQRNVSPTLEKHPLLGAAAETAGTALEGVGWFLGGRGALNAASEMRTAGRAAELTHKPYTRAPVADVAKRYTVLPEDAQHSAGMVATGEITGSTRAKLGPNVSNSEVPIGNVRIATQRATQDLPGQLLDANGRVDAGLLRGALDAETIPYQQVAQLPPPQTNTLAARVRTAWQERGGSLKGDVVAESRLMPLMDELGAPLPTDELLRRWREVNGYASDLRKASGEGSAAAQIKGADLRSISDAILDEIDSRAADFGAPGLVESLRGARVNMARLHALSDATDSVGWVDPTKLVAMAERHEPLTGGLAEVAADAAAAPRSLSPMKGAINAQDNQLDRFGREPHSWMRNVVGHLGGNILARRGITQLNEELRAGSGLLQQPRAPVVAPPLYPANAGPTQPPSPGMFFADVIPGPSTPRMPDAGRPDPSGPAFNQLLADQMSGGLTLEGQMPPAPNTGAPFARPLDTVDFGRDPTPGAPGVRQVPPPAEPVATVDRMSYEGQPGPFADALNPDLIPWEPPGAVPPLQGPRSSFADQLGPVQPRLDEALGTPPGMPNNPRGVSGPRSAQLSDPQLPEGLSLIDGSAPPQSFFGPGDEFPGPAAPEPPAPQGISDLIGDRLYRGVPEGADPMAPNERGFTTWSNERPVAERYGSTVGEMQFDPSTNVHLGTLEDARMLLGLPNTATAQDIAEAAMRRFGGSNKTASYDLRPELDGTPREYIRFPDPPQ
jgi:hypothetical protein